MSSKLKYYKNWNVTKTDLSPKQKCHQNWNVTNTEMSPKLKFYQNWYVTQTEVSTKLNRHQNWNFINTDISPKLKSYKNWYVIKYNNVIKIKIQEMGTDYLGLGSIVFCLVLRENKSLGIILWSIFFPTEISLIVIGIFQNFSETLSSTQIYSKSHFEHLITNGVHKQYFFLKHQLAIC